MKKLFALLLCMLMAATAFWLAGCSKVVDTGGIYRQSDNVTVQSKLENVDFRTFFEGNFNMYEQAVIESKRGVEYYKSTGTLTGLMDIATFSVKGHLNTSTKSKGMVDMVDPAEQATSNVNTDFIITNGNLYFTLDGQKVYMSLMSVGAEIFNKLINSVETSIDKIANIGSSDALYYLHEKGNTLKVKIVVESEQNSAVSKYYYYTELYIVCVDNSLTGIAMNVRSESSDSDYSAKSSVEIQLGSTTETLMLPMLSDYTEYLE